MNDLERALYPNEADWPLGIDVHGDEHENPNQPRRPQVYLPMTEAQRLASDAFGRKWMLEHWGYEVPKC